MYKFGEFLINKKESFFVEVEDMDARIKRHGGMEGFMKHVVGQAGEAFAAKQQLMAIAQQMNNPDITAGLEEAMKNNPTRLLIWANAIKTPQDLQAKYDDWIQRGIITKPQKAAGSGAGSAGGGAAGSGSGAQGPVEIGIKDPYQFYRSLTPDQRGDIKNNAYQYSRRGRIYPPKWAHRNDAPVLNQLYELVASKGKLNVPVDVSMGVQGGQSAGAQSGVQGGQPAGGAGGAAGGAAGGGAQSPVEIGIKDPVKFFNSLKQEWKRDVQKNAVAGYIEGKGIVKPKWVHPKDLAVLSQVYKLVAAQIKRQQGPVKIGIKDPVKFFNSLKQEWKRDVQKNAVAGYIEGKAIVKPKWVHPEDIAVLSQVYKLVAAQIKRQKGS